MRPEIKFVSLETLIDQMDQDSGKAREILKSLK
jgi:FAD synthase